MVYAGPGQWAAMQMEEVVPDIAYRTRGNRTEGGCVSYVAGAPGHRLPGEMAADASCESFRVIPDGAVLSVDDSSYIAVGPVNFFMLCFKRFN